MFIAYFIILSWFPRFAIMSLPTDLTQPLFNARWIFLGESGGKNYYKQKIRSISAPRKFLYLILSYLSFNLDHGLWSLKAIYMSFIWHRCPYEIINSTIIFQDFLFYLSSLMMLVCLKSICIFTSMVTLKYNLTPRRGGGERGAFPTLLSFCNEILS